MNFVAGAERSIQRSSAFRAAVLSVVAVLAASAPGAANFRTEQTVMGRENRRTRPKTPDRYGGRSAPRAPASGSEQDRPTGAAASVRGERGRLDAEVDRVLAFYENLF